jgi:hypothetical protein
MTSGTRARLAIRACPGGLSVAPVALAGDTAPDHG